MPPMKSPVGLVVATALVFLVPGLRTQDKSPRSYFEELKNAGAFVHTVTDTNGEKLSAEDTGFVCFAENNPAADSGGLFLTFKAMTYDKDYAAAATILASNASVDERKTALAKMEDIKSRQPYVDFIPDELLSALPADAADFFRKGGEELDLSLYLHGVKSWTVVHHRFGGDGGWKSENGKMDFSVEPTTMRFLWSIRGDKPQVLDGRCEKIYKDKQ